MIDHIVRLVRYLFGFIRYLELKINSLNESKVIGINYSLILERFKIPSFNYYEHLQQCVVLRSEL
jgi:hypothetical protein